MTEKEYWYWLLTIPMIGNKTIHKLLTCYGSPQGVFRAKKEELLKIEGIGEKMASSILNSRMEERVRNSYANLKRKGIYFITRQEAAFPKKLKEIPDPPWGIYGKGNLPEENRKTIAIVGARSCSNYGKEMALFFGAKLAGKGVQIVSGLARGIDGYAHRGALREKGSTFGILGCGIDICYPRENFKLYLEMQERGGVLSEYGPGIAPLPGYFPMRNRIISGLCDGVLVIEAKEKSGSLITADMGLDQGKEIFALPGRAGDPFSRGCNNLIKEGACLVDEPEDILKNFGMEEIGDGRVCKNLNNSLETNEKIVYASLSLVPKHLNELIGECSLFMTEIMECLISLELKGYIKQTANNYYAISYDRE